jgi:hypothetical protein
MPGVVDSRGTPLERLGRRCIVLENDCWEWQAASTGAGYGVMFYEGRMQMAYRVAYQLIVGPIPAGLVMDHLCRNPRCVNPAHVEPVTQRENVRRGLGGGLTTHCPAGHAYTTENTYVFTNERGMMRKCRACHRERERLRRARARYSHVVVGDAWAEDEWATRKPASGPRDEP